MTARIVARVLGRLIVGSVVACASARTTGSGPTARWCVSGHWLPARPLRTTQGNTVFMDFPAIVPMHGKAFILGALAYTYDSLGNAIWPLVRPPGAKVTRPEQIAVGVIADTNGVSQLVPQSKDLAVWPNGSIAASDDSGVTHVVWASNDSSPATSIALMRSLWYARLEHDQWSTPLRILTTDGTILWTASTKSGLVARGGTLHMATAMSGEGVRYLRFSDGVWTNRTVRELEPFTGYPHVAVLGDGRVVVVVQGGVPSPFTNFMSAMFASWSDDGGRSWAPSIQVSDPLSEPTYDLQLLADGDVLHAVWYQQTGERGEPALRPNLADGPGRVQIATSRDHGLTWQRAAASSLLPGAHGLQAIVQRDHAILVALINGTNQSVYTATWSNGWSAFESHDAQPQPFNPTLGLDGAQRPVLTWGIRHRHDWPGTMMSTYMPCQ